MKRLLIICVAIFATVVVIISSAWHAAPKTTAKYLLAINNASAGLSARKVDTELGEINYLEGGSGETVLLIHGIYARKEHWVEVARQLTKDFHIIAIDLPGFGDNALLETGEYRPLNQERNLGIVIEALNLERIHIGANSMGAYVSALYAVQNSDKISSFAFIGSPLGVPSPFSSDMDRAIADGNFPLIATSEAGFVERNDWLSPSPLELPSPILSLWMSQELKQSPKNVNIWNEVHNGHPPPNLLNIAAQLDMRTLIIWCDADRIFHISGASVLNATLPDSEFHELENCGHVPMIDAPEDVAKLYLEFLHAVD